MLCYCCAANVRTSCLIDFTISRFCLFVFRLEYFRCTAVEFYIVHELCSQLCTSQLGYGWHSLLGKHCSLDWSGSKKWARSCADKNQFLWMRSRNSKHCSQPFLTCNSIAHQFRVNRCKWKIEECSWFLHSAKSCHPWWVSEHVLWIRDISNTDTLGYSTNEAVGGFLSLSLAPGAKLPLDLSG